MPSNKKLLQAAAGSAGGDPLYVEDVFSTYLYDGNGSTQTITNGIDLDGEGGLVWLKARSETQNHALFDTERGATKLLSSSTTGAESTLSGVSGFNSNGFDLGSFWNSNSQTYASWTFRKAEKFFGVVTWTGNATAGREIAHNLGSVPGVMIVKAVSGTYSGSAWTIYHKDLTATDILEFDTGVTKSRLYAWNDTTPTDSVFTVGSGSETNGGSTDYVAYLFASDAGGFGDDGTENIIKCGTYGPGTETLDGPEVNLGWEPQWVLTKCYDSTGDWVLHDNMRGVVTDGDDKWLRPNTSGAELTTENIIFKATGFKITSVYAYVNQSGKNYIYMAIRRGPMKTPESGTEVFVMDTPDSTSPPKYRSPFPVDMAWFRANVNSSGGTEIVARLTGTKYLFTDSTAAEANQNGYTWDFENGWFNDQGTEANNWSWMLKRAPGFMDVVCYDGVGGGQTVNHGLGVAPEMIWIKNRDVAEPWAVGHIGLNSGSNPWEYWLMLNDVDGEQALTSTFNDTPPTATQFTVGNDRKVDYAGQYYTAYFFGTVAGVSKVGSYNGADEANVDVDCGFTAGARFILIKRTDTTGNWFYWDYERGIVAGNDPYLLLNSTAAQVTNTDYIDPLASGFTVTSAASFDGLNNIGGTYIFLAIAQEYQL